ncbi:MAG: hypothetical protein JO307_12040 [Bryobacterales bacterium]|nr:hypothetical protein [Bryobacterales bacterium]
MLALAAIAAFKQFSGLLRIRSELAEWGVFERRPASKTLTGNQNPDDVAGVVELQFKKAESTPRLALIPDLLWSGNGFSTGWALCAGALAWLTFSAIVVLAHGVVLDQDLVPAQIIAGAVHYPPGHPHDVFYHRVFNLPSYLLAALWTVWPNPEALSGVRNWLHIFLGVFVPYAVTVVVAGRPCYGHIAAMLALSNAARKLQGVYPMTIYPGFDSDGHFGEYSSVLIVALLLGRFWKSGGFLLGVLPAIHPTMAAVVWPWAFVYLWFHAGRMQRSEKRHLLVCIGIGLALCAALGGVMAATAPNTAVQPPYDYVGDSSIVYRNFEEFTDTHRRPLPLSTYGYSFHPLILFTLLGLLIWKTYTDNDDVTRRVVIGLAGLSTAAWVYVAAGSALMNAYSGGLASLARISMPGRFSNLTAIVVIPLSVALIARARTAALWIVPLLLAQAALMPVHHVFLERIFILAITGAALASTLIPFRFAVRGWPVPVLVAPIALIFIFRPIDSGSAFRITPEDHNLNSWLRANTAPDEPILTPMAFRPELQVKTNHPVMMEGETVYLMTYMPSLAGLIGEMARDLYGIDYTDKSKLGRGRFNLRSGRVMSAWQAKTASEWADSGRRYRFRLVASPTIIPLPLTVGFRGARWTLYVIE